MNTRTMVGLVLAAMLVMVGGCQDLDVTNPNEPDRERALAQPEDVETLLGGTWSSWWNRLVNRSALYYAMTNIADETTATYANGASLELSSEPRIPFNNNPTSDAHGIARFPWGDFNEILANTSDILNVINEGLVLETVDPGADDKTDNTERAMVYAKFLQGMSLGYLALFFDRGYYVDENTDLETLPDLVPYTVLRDSAISRLEEAISLTQTADDFELPEEWMFMTGVDNDRLAQIANSLIARVMVYSPRSVEERADVDWNKVIQHVEAGIGADMAVDPATGWHDDDYAPVMSGTTIWGNFWWYIQNNGSFSMHSDYKLIGASDVSGNYQAWLASDLSDRDPFLITTPDRRITGPGDGTVPSAESDGKYFEYRASIPFTESRGIYHFSHYQWNRRNGDYWNGPAHIMTVSEMNLFLAEAHYRLGNLDRAAELINISRVGVGELPPVTAAGVPQAADCVPRPQENPAGPCGSLLDALHYERMIEGSGLDTNRTWMDRRGFGSLTTGTFLHLPIPGRELESLGMPIYTFGGVGGVGAAP